MFLDGTGARYGIIGDPISHSLSPLIHNLVLQHSGRNDILLPFLVHREQLGLFVEALPILDLKGFAITMPHKTGIVPYLAEMDETVRTFGAANAVKVVDGRLHGFMFDGEGFVRSLQEEGVDLSGRRVLILGAGGVTGAVALSLAKRGVKSVTFLNRTVEHARQMAEAIAKAAGVPTHSGGFTPEELAARAEQADLVVQATSLGMHGTGQDYADLRFVARFPKDAVVADVIYNPAETSFLKAAREQGRKTVNGLGMLIYQAVLIQQHVMDLDVTPEAIALQFQAVRKAIYG